MTAGALDRYDLYERCVQSPAEQVAMLRAVHGGDPAVLGEDFCGTAAISAAWVRAVPGGRPLAEGSVLRPRAIAVDRDAEALARAARSPGIEIVHGDVVAATCPDRHRADVVYAGNFSIGEWHRRGDLLAYLRHAAARLEPGGVFVCDTYGGQSAFETGRIEIDHPLAGGRTARYTWEQRAADPVTGRVVDVLHFAVLRDGEIEQELPDAFVYDWRLWSLPELGDALAEAGLGRVEVWPRVPDAVDDAGRAHVVPIRPGDLDASWDVLVTGRR